MKPKLFTFVLMVLSASFLFYCCKKPENELSAEATANANLLTIGKTATNTSTLTDPVIVYYVGDLSVTLASTGQFKLDSCTKLVRVNYNITVKNINGNSKFSFDVQFFKNGTAATFYYPDGSTKDNGRARIETLNINETRTISGYIVTPYVALNTDISNVFELKGQISELLVQSINQPIYKLETDLVPRNNVSTVQTSLPSFAFSKSVFDDLPLVSMPSGGYFYGYQATKLYPDQPNYAPFSLYANYPTNNQVYIGYGLSQTGPIQFVKAGCLPVSGKPFYYMISRGKYLTYWLGKGVLLEDPTATSETARRWVFTAASSVENTPGSSYAIYNMALGQNFRLQVRWSEEERVNFIGIGSPDAVKQQVFNLR